MFDYVVHHSKFVITAGDVRIHECHSKTVAVDIVEKLSSGQLLRDILVSNIDNLARLDKRKSENECSRAETSIAKLNKAVAEKSLEIEKAKTQINELQDEIIELKKARASEVNLEKEDVFRSEVTSEIYSTFTGSYDAGATQKLKDLTAREIIQLSRYIAIFKSNDFQEHWQVNESISYENAWEKFDALRSNNRHANDFLAKGIHPKYYAIVCSILGISADGGSSLLDAHRY